MNQSQPTNPPVPIVRQRLRYVTIGFYIAAAFLYWISLYLYVPTLPTYVQTKTDNLAVVGTVLSMYGLWQAIVMGLRWMLAVTALTTLALGLLGASKLGKKNENKTR